MAVNDIFHATVVWEYISTGQEITTNLHYRQTVFGSFLSDSAQCENMATLLFNVVKTGYMDTVANSAFRLMRIESYIVNKPTFFGVSTNSPATGAWVAEMTPFQTAPMLHKTTGLRGASYRGRNYLLPVSEDQQDAGQIASAVLTAVNTFANNLLVYTTPAGDEYSLTIYSPTKSDPATGVFLDNIVTDIVTRSFVKSQRRRGL